MTRWHALMGPLLGTALVLHCLGNTVIPLRGLDASATGQWMPAMTLLYAVAIVGFVVAGLGVWGLGSVSRTAVPASWIAGVAGMLAKLAYGIPDLWLGIAFSAALPLLTTLYVTTVPHHARHSQRPPIWHWLGAAAGTALLVWVTASTVVWPWARAWGTTHEEWLTALPGDRAPRTPHLEIFHGVTIDAPPEVVWSWLVQLGQDRAGFYSYDWLERLFGSDIHNADEVRPEWQTRQPGDRVYATQAGYLGGLFGERPGWAVTMAEPNRALVLETWGAFVLVPQPEGRTRLLVRSTISHDRIPVWAAALNFTVFELPHFIMQRRMLLGIKARAERPTT